MYFLYLFANNLLVFTDNIAYIEDAFSLHSAHVRLLLLLLIR